MIWLIKQIVGLVFIVVMLAAWNVPSYTTWQFWVGLFAMAFYMAVANVRTK